MAQAYLTQVSDEPFFKIIVSGCRLSDVCPTRAHQILEQQLQVLGRIPCCRGGSPILYTLRLTTIPRELWLVSCSNFDGAFMYPQWSFSPNTAALSSMPRMQADGCSSIVQVLAAYPEKEERRALHSWLFHRRWFFLQPLSLSTRAAAHNQPIYFERLITAHWLSEVSSSLSQLRRFRIVKKDS